MDANQLLSPLVVEPGKGRKRVHSVSALHDTANVALWYDTRQLSHLPDSQCAEIIEQIISSGFNGVVFYLDNFSTFSKEFSASHFAHVLHLADVAQLEAAQAERLVSPTADAGNKLIISSANTQLLVQAAELGCATCYRAHVNNAESLCDSFRYGVRYDYVMVSFKDPTNIPLELVIAELHKESAHLLKEVGEDVDDAVIALGVLELGSDGIVASFTQPAQFDALRAKLDAVCHPAMKIQVGTVTETRHLGLGYRACIDTTHIFEPDEGILVGSTSTGGVLCCPEVFHLPYMELRPFRINAASVHSYVFHASDKTNYITELRAGSAITAVNAAGRTRQVYVGRVKTEIRPLILIAVSFDGGEQVNIVMQDDWHVRIFSDKAQPRHLTELKPGDRVLGYTTQPGRHVGVKVDEHIIEV
ncbi:3-dehydroquinate synthase II [Paraburkholderia dilworthii]|uniref:3-dehydroquinate synthase II n=1 Tax=Paraburkholderia dilworthii TaxID=948106 RepID=UPI000403D797|nr:3-dehydroquinate synthase II [Paraburkholderia dilworthii]